MKLTKGDFMRILTALLIGLALSGCASSDSTPFNLPPLVLSESPKFLIAGQSNGVSPAQSHPPYYSQTGRVTVTDVYHGGALRIPTLANPMDGSIAWIYLGDYLNRDVTFVNIARGNQSTQKWVDIHFNSLMVPALEESDYDAILWIQGESDMGEFIPEDVTYRNMRKLIAQSCQIKCIPWVIAINSRRTTPQDNSVRRAQMRIIADGLAYEGPDTDSIRNNPAWVEASGDEFVGDGLREHGYLWSLKLEPYFSR